MNSRLRAKKSCSPPASAFDWRASSQCILMRLLTKLAYEGDPATRHVQYAFAELAEECRHSTMFARLIEWMGVPCYRPSRRVHELGRLLTATAHGPARWGAILIGEEITDRYQR